MFSILNVRAAYLLDLFGFTKNSCSRFRHWSWHTNLVKSRFHIILVYVVLIFLPLLTFNRKFWLNQTVLRVIILTLIAQTLFLINFIHFFYLAYVLQRHFSVVGLHFEVFDQTLSLFVFKQRWICIRHCIGFRYYTNTVLNVIFQRNTTLFRKRLKTFVRTFENFFRIFDNAFELFYS